MTRHTPQHNVDDARLDAADTCWRDPHAAADHPDNSATRRDFIKQTAGGVSLAAIGLTVGWTGKDAVDQPYVWQIDPSRCRNCIDDTPQTCDKCMDRCVLSPSAVRVVHAYAACGYCRLCTGFFTTDAPRLDEAAENQLCPVNAIKRTFVGDPYFEYTIDEDACIGCGRCAKGCAQYGNGSLYMQIRHERCVDCNKCAIAEHCPNDAVKRVPADAAYIDRFPPPAGVERVARVDEAHRANPTEQAT